MAKEWTFNFELNDARLVKVVFEPEFCGSGEIEYLVDESGREFALSEVSEQDREEIEKVLILELQSAQASQGISDRDLIAMARANREEWSNE